MLQRILIVGALLAGSAWGQDDVARLVAELGNTNHNTRYAAYRALLTKKLPAAVPLLIRSLPGYQIYCQSLGLSVLQSYPQKLAESALNKLLKSESAFLKLGAAAALYHRGDRSHVDLIVAALQSTSSVNDVTLMLSRLYSIRDARVKEAVRNLVKPNVNISVLDAALRFLQNTKDPQATKVAERIATSEAASDNHKASCLAFLVAMGESQHGKALAKTLRSGGVRSISRVYGYLNQAPHLDKEVLNTLVELVEQNTNSTQIRLALQVLAKHRHHAAVPVIRKLLENNDTRVSKAAFDALLKMGDELKPKSLRELLDPDRPALCIIAADGLRRLDDMSGLPPLLDVVKKTSGQTKADAIAALGKFRSRKVVDTLIDALNDENLNVRTRAVSGLNTVLRALFPYKRIDLASVGYSVSAPASKRRDGAALVRVWWKRNRPTLEAGK